MKKKTAGREARPALARLVSRLTRRQPEPSPSRAVVTWLTGGKTRTRRTRRRH